MSSGAFRLSDDTGRCMANAALVLVLVTGVEA